MRLPIWRAVIITRVEELPTGTVTMLFSDIEESTLLLRRLGDRYGEALSAHRALLREAFGAHGGREMDTEGDSFFVVFPRARDAVNCCVAAQRSLAAHQWPAGATVRVRMGIHTGEPTRHEEGYVGLDVHRAARIAATAHGAQVVLSDATRVLVEEALPAEVSVRDPGWHRLKDIEAPERIHQLVVPGLADRFPPLKSLGAESSVPVPPTPLVDREEDVERICAALRRPGARLVTLTGAGGVGKTRLALMAAATLGEAFPHGVFFLPLAAVTEGDAMWRAIADGLGVGGEEPVPAATEYLSRRHALLVLDSLEQLHEAGGVVASLLSASPQLTVLATSRRPLHLQGEQEQPVSPLEVPADTALDTVAASTAVQLFVQHAAMVSPGFAITEANAADVAAICRRLDGLPLAIELAASRIRLLGPKALLARLGRSLELAGSEVGRPTRHQTLRATAAWSYELLAPELARVLERVSVFVGGCDLEAIAAVALSDEGAGPDPLPYVADLLDMSLITVTEGVDGEPRVGMLETIREFALERLEQSGDLDASRRRHAEHFAAFAERMQQQLLGVRHMASLDRLEAEHENLRAVLSWCLEEPAGPLDIERAGLGLRLVQAIAPFWYDHGHASEGRRWMELAVEVAPVESAPLAQVAHWLAVFLQQQGEYGAAVQLFERSLAIWDTLGDQEQVARELNSLAITHRYLGDLDKARSLLLDSIAIARELGNDRRLATALSNLGQTESAAGNLDRAAEVLQQALELDRALGDLLGVAIDKQSLAAASLRAGRPEEAHQLLVSLHDYLVGSRDIEFLVTTVELHAGVAAARGDAPSAARLTGAAEVMRRRAGMPIPLTDAALLEKLLTPARATIPGEAWEAEKAAGAALNQQQVLALVAPPLPRQP